MAAIAFVAVSLHVIGIHSDSPAHRFHTSLRIDLPSSTTQVRKGEAHDPPEWPAILGELTSPAVLDAALSDAHLSTLPRLYNAPDPARELSRMIRIRSDSRAGVVRIDIEGDVPAEPVLAAQALADAIRSKGPPGASVTRVTAPMLMPLAPAFLDRRWKLAVAILAVMLATTAILILPAASGRRSSPRSERPVRFTGFIRRVVRWRRQSRPGERRTYPNTKGHRGVDSTGRGETRACGAPPNAPFARGGVQKVSD